MDYGLRAAWEIAPFAAMLVLAIVASTVRYDSSESTKEIITLAFLVVMVVLSSLLVVRTRPEHRLAALSVAVLTMLYAVLVTAAAFVTDS